MCQIWFTSLVGPAHLIVHDCGPELVNEVDYFLRIFRLVKESCRLFLLQYGLRTLSDFLQGANTMLERVAENTVAFTWRAPHAASLPRNQRRP